MSHTDHPNAEKSKATRRKMQYTDTKPPLPLPNYTLSTVCPACGNETYKLACKVRCNRCGFMWDCSEL